MRICINGVLYEAVGERDLNNQYELFKKQIRNSNRGRKFKWIGVDRDNNSVTIEADFYLFSPARMNDFGTDASLTMAIISNGDSTKFICTLRNPEDSFSSMPNTDFLNDIRKSLGGKNFKKGTLRNPRATMTLDRPMTQDDFDEIYDIIDEWI